MNDRNTTDEKKETAAGKGAAAGEDKATPWAGGAEAGAEAAAGGPEDAAGEAADPVAALQADNERLKDQLLRALADQENLRQRTARELNDARAYAIANFARDVLAVSDNLRRALEALPDSERAGADPALTALLQGVEMTERELQQTLEKHRVRRLDPTGERFDPHFHQAMFEVEDASVPAGTVVQLVQAGYVIGERMLRPAMVGVARGGPKPAKEDEAGGEAGAGDGEPAAPGDAGSGSGAGPAAGGVGARVDRSA